MKQSDFPAPPQAYKEPKVFRQFGTERIDNYYWMHDKRSPQVQAYLQAENRYTTAVTASTEDLQKTLYDEMVGRIQEDDESCPLYDNGYWYYRRTEKGKQYACYYRKKDLHGTDCELLFDGNALAEGTDAFLFDDYTVSPDNGKGIYLYNDTGSYADFTLKIRDFTTGADMPFAVSGVVSAAWANDSTTFFYTVVDSALRSSKVYRTTAAAAAQGAEAVLVYEETDARFSVYVSEEKTRQFILISSVSTTTTEERLIPADTPCGSYTVFLPRKKECDYSVYPHKDCFFVRYKDGKALNGKIYTAPLQGFGDVSTWKEILPHDSEARIESLDVLSEYLVVEMRKNGLLFFKIIPLADFSVLDVPFPDPVYAATLVENPEYNSNAVRYVYESLHCPRAVCEFSARDYADYAIRGDTLWSGTLPELERRAAVKVLKQQIVPSGFNSGDYTVERLWATAEDGVQIPIALVYKNGINRANGVNGANGTKGFVKDGSAPALVYGYGSYGYSSDAYFDTRVYSLIDRGFVYAVAQVRGGSDLGEQWYEDGKLLKKKNTFTDFIACCKHLIQAGYTSADRLAVMGGSAGGLLMGAVTNMRPDLFRTVVAAVPFVDVLTSMLDDSLPLTVGEYEEWGNPNEEDYYHYMHSYSPYDNITEQHYPNMLITGGINDSQVLFHEPAKYTAKLREYKQDNNVILLHMDMDSGHGGATGRYGKLKDTAFEYAFILANTLLV